MQNHEIFKGKTLQDVFKDIYDNQLAKKQELDALTKVLAKLIVKADDAYTVGPVIQQFLETSVKNDEQLIKMATIVQRIMANEAKDSGMSDGHMLSEQERDRLIENALGNMKTAMQEVQDEIDSTKSKI